MTRDYSQSLGECLKHWRLSQGLPLEAIAFKTRVPLKYLRALEANDFSDLPPIDTLDLTLGDSLRRYREQQGLSLNKIAEQTRVPLSYLKALEENNTLHMPVAPVIARSFVDAYLNCLGLHQSQKEELLIQFAKVAEAVYAKPGREPSVQCSASFGGTFTTLLAPLHAVHRRCHEWALTASWMLMQWKSAGCLWIVSAALTLKTRGSRLSKKMLTSSVEGGKAASRTIGLLSGRLWQHVCSGLNRLPHQSQPRQTPTSGPWQLQPAYHSMYQDPVPPTPWTAGRQHFPATAIFPLSPSGSGVHQAPPNPAGKTWIWIVKYGITILFLLLLGSTAPNIPLFKDTALVETKLNVSHLVEFLGYGGSAVAVLFISRQLTMLLDRDRSGLAFLRPLVVPLTALLMTSSSHKIALILMNPFFSKAGRLAYDWISIVLILLSALWVIFAWFFRSAPMLESLEANGSTTWAWRSSPPSGYQNNSHSRQIGTKYCGRCGSAIPAGLEWAGDNENSLRKAPGSNRR